MSSNKEDTEKIQKLKKICEKTDKCKYDIKQKMYSLKIEKKLQEKILTILVEENYINENRYAQNYCRGKFRINKWGKQKIINALKSKNISSTNIKNGINEINTKLYKNLIQELISKKNENFHETDINVKRKKIARFLLQKGFESSLVWKNINNLITK
jgi:regulatory protein